MTALALLKRLEAGGWKGRDGFWTAQLILSSHASSSNGIFRRLYPHAYRAWGDAFDFSPASPRRALPLRESRPTCFCMVLARGAPTRYQCDGGAAPALGGVVHPTQNRRMRRVGAQWIRLASANHAQARRDRWRHTECVGSATPPFGFRDAHFAAGRKSSLRPAHYGASCDDHLPDWSRRGAEALRLFHLCPDLA